MSTILPTPLTLPDGLPAIIPTAISNLETVKQARNNIKGAAEPLDSISIQADILIRSLLLIKDIHSLQTLRVGEQIYQVMDLASRLGASMLVIAADSSSRTPPQEITPDNYVYGHLVTMKGQLQEAKDTLVELVRSVLVGVSGNPKDGFRVSLKDLVKANEKVREVMGVEMRLFERLRGKIVVVGEEGKVGGCAEETVIINLDDADIEHLGLPRVSGDMVEQWRATVGAETGITQKNEQ
ncbi:hypothetical protein SMACR_05982 [Sordaria macrospora]|uniref:WGS project CABT00000000 data, contig 2.6 n=2 Tax=Sordaria macrospora TaxID=5147 RepID=F7VTH2_SORMK|nr:uncharacterized protein SMAC_05982 [Sordaria macrospora k-hell]KAA8633195.1 hypothetical protein SMACR_05982 [Sordaria macrospora]WPJ57747.1 hypothetical protein SMAC4_05982 [Sordaria macrospora]CCC08628.1 unnamed protein product [Sordaria macrospora k-hell]